MSTKEQKERIELLQGTLDLLILRTLLLGPMHGHAIAKAIEFRSDDVLQVEQGSLYPALHRLIKRRWISVEEGTSENNPPRQVLQVNGQGPAQLVLETNRWDALAGAIARFSGRRSRRANHEATQRMLDDLDQDIRDHLERETRTTLERGMSAEEARYAALRKFGNVTRVKEETRDVWSVVWLEQLIQDARFGLRTLWRSPGLTVAAVLAIGLGIGVNVGVFSVLNGAALRLLPVPRAEQIVSVSQILHGEPRATFTAKRACSPIPEYLNYRDYNHVFTGLVAYEPFVEATLAGGMWSSFWEPQSPAITSAF